MYALAKFIFAYLIPLAIVATIWVGIFITIKKSFKR